MEQYANEMREIIERLRTARTEIDKIYSTIKVETETDYNRKDYIGCAYNLISEAMDYVAEARDFIDFAVQGYRD